MCRPGHCQCVDGDDGTRRPVADSGDRQQRSQSPDRSSDDHDSHYRDSHSDGGGAVTDNSCVVVKEKQPVTDIEEEEEEKQEQGHEQKQEQADDEMDVGMEDEVHGQEEADDALGLLLATTCNCHQHNLRGRRSLPRSRRSLRQLLRHHSGRSLR